jgi:AraC-like DNA-binding protein
MIREQCSVKAAAVAIRDAILAEPLTKKTPSELAAQYYVDRNKLLQAFKELTGSTIRRFQLEQLMNAASKMLLSGMTIKEVSIECGYPDYRGNFTRSFKKVFEIAPDEWLHKQLIERINGSADAQRQKNTAFRITTYPISYEVTS